MYNYRVNPGYVRIENLAQYLVKVPQYHPEDPRYRNFWSYEIAKCIEGVYGKQSGGYRFMPGNLYFYGNYTKLQTTNIFKETEWIKPYIRDLDWEICYYMWEAKGFSGFELDDEYTSDERYFAIKTKGWKLSDVHKEIESDRVHYYAVLFNEKGELKKYMSPRENIRRLHKEPMGKMLVFNEARNFQLFGSRGGGKSYYFSLAEYLYTLLFDGAKTYEAFLKGELKSEVVIGAANVDSSSEFCNKIVDCLDLLKEDPELGAWGKPGEEDYTPSPLFREMSGSILVSNKKNPFNYSYSVLEHGVEITKGTKSALFHVNYATNKKTAAEAAAGGRYNVNGCEEIGLMSNYIEALGSNNATVSRDGVQFGVQVGFGTSGNIEYVQSAKKVFLDPTAYRFLAIEDVWEFNGKDGKTGFFLPYAATLQNYKDKDGNTDWEKAFDYIETKLAEAASSSDPAVLRRFKMNYPNVPSDMWTTDQGYLLPYEEAVERKKELYKNNLYKTLGTPVSLKWDHTAAYGVSYDVLHNAEPFYIHPIDVKKMSNPSGCVVIYEQPTFVNGIIPPDLYKFVGHDPYVAEEIDKGGSLGVTYIVKNPKYLSQGITGNIIVASYIGKPLEGLSKYYENQEKLLAYYGNPPQSLWYEAVRGDICRSHYIKKNKIHLLCIAPQREQGSNLYQRNIVRTGFSIGNKLAKLNLIQNFNDWLLEDLTLTINGVEETRKVIGWIPCLFLVSQIEAFNLDGNFDAVSGMLGAILGLREYEHVMQSENTRKKRGNTLSKLSDNPGLFVSSQQRIRSKFFNQQNKQDEKLYNDREFVPNPGGVK